LIENKLHNFEVDSKYKETLQNLKVEIGRLETILIDPDYVIYEQISELKRQVFLDREQTKSQIDALADDLINQLESYEKSFKENYKRNVDLKHYNGIIEKSKKQLNEYEKCLNSFSAKKEERDEKSNQRVRLLNELQSQIKEAKGDLFSNLSIMYEPIGNIENLYGKLIIKVRFSLL
jgi:chromosome segregation ATPase